MQKVLGQCCLSSERHRNENYSSLYFVPNVATHSAQNDLSGLCCGLCDDYNAHFPRRGSHWHAVLTRWGASAFPQRSEGFLDHHFPEKWVGMGGYITWPSHSPDLTPLHTLRMLCNYAPLLVATLPVLPNRQELL